MVGISQPYELQTTNIPQVFINYEHDLTRLNGLTIFRFCLVYTLNIKLNMDKHEGIPAKDSSQKV